MIKRSNKLSRYDLVSNVKTRTFKGQSVEILNSNIFNVPDNLLNKYDKEHVTKYFYANKYKIYNYKLEKNIVNIIYVL